MFRSSIPPSIATLTVALSGIAAQAADDSYLWREHIVLVTSLGQAVEPGPSQATSTVPKSDFSDIFAEKDKFPDQKIIIFIQGGLDDLDSAIQRAKEPASIAAMEAKGYYPLFIGWDANLGTSYWEHLKTARGIYEPNNWVATLPLTLVADLGGAISNAPLSFFHQFFETDVRRLKFASSSFTNKTDYVPIHGINPEPQVVNNEYAKLRLLYEKYPDSALKVELGDFHYSSQRAIFGSATYLASLPAKTLMLPVLQTGGLGAWQRMRGRVINLFHKPYEFTLLDVDHHPTEDEFTAAVLPDDAPANYPSERAGGLALFMKELEAYQKRHPYLKIDLVAHSAGTIVASEMLFRNPRLKYDHIVFMAAACSLNDLEKSVLPYLRRHQCDPVPTPFYDLCLHPQHEVDEWRLQKVLLSNDIEEFVAERGSLLEWIDNFYSTPESFMDRVAGKWENIIQAAHIIPGRLRPLITIKGFGADADSITIPPSTAHGIDEAFFEAHASTGPQAHGDFSWWPYWEPWLWTVKPPGETIHSGKN